MPSASITVSQYCHATDTYVSYPTYVYNSSLFVAIQPITTSECPPIYLVTLCTTRSAPRTTGFCSAGVKKVLSTATRTPLALAIAEIARISATFRVGFVGVSMQ